MAAGAAIDLFVCCFFLIFLPKNQKRQSNLIPLKLTLLNASLLAHQAPQVEEPGAANFSAFGNSNVYNVGRSERKNTLDAYTVGNLPNRESLGIPLTFDLDYITTEGLYTLLIPFNNLVVNDDVIASPKIGMFRLLSHLLMHKFDGVHLSFFE